VAEVAPEIEAELADDLSRFIEDPLGFVEYAFAWGSGDLEGQTGPDEWQREFLVELGEQVKRRAFDGHTSVLPVRMAVGSGHGIGKSALVAWGILWIMSTRPGCRGSVTASTVTQLQTKTIPELQKWATRSICSHWFDVDTTKIVHSEDRKSWRADFLTARKENSEAFAGQHNAQSTSFYVMDESSGVPDEIFEVAEGGLTDGEPMMFCFGNRTKPTGYFNSLFTRRSKRWWTRCIDSRYAKMTNKAQIAEWAEDWGEDSDFFRVRVMGLAPSASAEQLIPVDQIEDARTRTPVWTLKDALVMGVDVARFGDDESVIVFRKGGDARSIPSLHMKGWDTQDVAEQVAASIKEYKPAAVFVDGGGLGGGVVDRLRALGFPQVVEVNFGGRSLDPQWFNKRAEMWGTLKLEIGRGLGIEDHDELQDELAQQEYSVDEKTRKTRLVGKQDMRRIGLKSPDWADALALTYAQPVGWDEDGAEVQEYAIM